MKNFFLIQGITNFQVSSNYRQRVSGRSAREEEARRKIEASKPFQVIDHSKINKQVNQKILECYLKRNQNNYLFFFF